MNNAVKDAEHVVVIGGGFLGSELVCALAAQGASWWFDEWIWLWLRNVFSMISLIFPYCYSVGKKRGLKVTQVYPEEGL